jgi:hypothetical protein
MGNPAPIPPNGPNKIEALCSRCGGAMNLIRIEPAWHFERRILECRECRKSDSYTT